MWLIIGAEREDGEAVGGEGSGSGDRILLPVFRCLAGGAQRRCQVVAIRAPLETLAGIRGAAYGGLVREYGGWPTLKRGDPTPR